MNRLTTIIIVASLAIDCPEPTMVEVPFVYDTNQVNYRVICQATMRAEQVFTSTLTACDPDGDELIYDTVGVQAGFIVDPNSGRFKFSPQVEGVYSIDVSVTDPFGAYDRGSIVVNVLQANRPPVFGGCSQ